jgi:cell division protein FtsB
MTPQELTNWLILIVIGIVGYLGQTFIQRLDRFEKKVENILIDNVSHSKDIERLSADVDDHEKRITKLEN